VPPHAAVCIHTDI